jgi:uncharacterized protein (UPF0333 family)
MEGVRKREANIKKELRIVILKNIDNFYKKSYHSQAIQFRPPQPQPTATTPNP